MAELPRREPGLTMKQATTLDDNAAHTSELGGITVRRLMAGVVTVLLLSACGVRAPQQDAAAQNGAGDTGASPTSPAAGDHPVAGPAGSQLKFNQPIAYTGECSYPHTYALHDYLSHMALTTADPDQVGRAAAVVQVTSVGAARWNTSDGHRWTQAEADTAAASSPSVEAYIYTPYTVSVVHPLRGGLAAGSTIVGFLRGGTVGQDKINLSCSVAQPSVGGEYVVFFGSELTTAAMGATPLSQPVITTFLRYDASADVVQTPSGPLNLTQQLQGLSPG